MCLLALISEESSYGYEMASKLQARGLELMSEGSIYPLLSRLKKRGYVDSYFVESPGGPPRKYYRILAAGQDRLRDWANEWNRVSDGVGEILKGANNV